MAVAFSNQQYNKSVPWLLTLPINELTLPLINVNSRKLTV